MITESRFLQLIHTSPLDQIVSCLAEAGCTEEEIEELKTILSE